MTLQRMDAAEPQQPRLDLDVVLFLALFFVLGTFHVQAGLQLFFNDSIQVSCRICTTYCTHKGPGFGDKKSPSPGFPGVKQRVPGYSLLASSRVLEPQIFVGLKVQLVLLVTSIDKSLYSRVAGFF